MIDIEISCLFFIFLIRGDQHLGVTDIQKKGDRYLKGGDRYLEVSDINASLV